MLELNPGLLLRSSDAMMSTLLPSSQHPALPFIIKEIYLQQDFKLIDRIIDFYEGQ